MALATTRRVVTETSGVPKVVPRKLVAGRLQKHRSVPFYIGNPPIKRELGRFLRGEKECRIQRREKSAQEVPEEGTNGISLA